MREQARIVVEALVAGGASRKYAIEVVQYAVVDMYKHGVMNPTKIPRG